jgi:hypothetical protein
MTTQKQIRAAFWQRFPNVKRQPQNDLPTDIRCEFVDFVDMLARDGQISESLAARVTL